MRLWWGQPIGPEHPRPGSPARRLPARGAHPHLTATLTAKPVVRDSTLWTPRYEKSRIDDTTASGDRRRTPSRRIRNQQVRGSSPRAGSMFSMSCVDYQVLPRSKCKAGVRIPLAFSLAAGAEDHRASGASGLRRSPGLGRVYRIEAAHICRVVPPRSVRAVPC